jgi:hypothetical protein
MVTIDLTNFKDKVGDRIPEGRYRVRVKDAEVERSNQGNPMIILWLEVLDGEDEGAIIVDRLTQTEKSLFRTVNFMKAIGLKAPKGRLTVNVTKWVGAVVWVDVADGEPYNNKVKSEVKGYEKALDAGRAKTATATDELAGLDEFRPTSDDIAAGVAEAAELSRVPDDEQEDALEHPDYPGGDDVDGQAEVEELEEVDLANLNL